LIYPIQIKDIIIEDSTILSFIAIDYKVSKKDALTVLDSLLQSSIIKAFTLNADFKNVFSCQIDSNRLFTEELGQNSSENKIPEYCKEELPTRFTEVLTIEECQADFILFISNISIDLSLDVTVDGGVWKPKIVISLADRYKIDVEDIIFELWDINKKQIVCKGNIETEATCPKCDQMFSDPVNGIEKVSFWPVLLDSVGNAIVNATPFSKSFAESGWGIQ
jgi:hypothetical protein